jgi:hypothetical protein
VAIEPWPAAIWPPRLRPNRTFGFLGYRYLLLNGVTAVSANDVWAVGTGEVNGIIDTQVLRWNGTAWQVVASPNVTGVNANQLNQITVVSPDDIWAVGYWAVLDVQYSTLTEHWNGTKWSVVTVPVPEATYSNLIGLAGISATDVWAVGSYQPSGGDWNPLYEHWNGQSWTITAG